MREHSRVNSPPRLYRTPNFSGTKIDQPNDSFEPFLAQCEMTVCVSAQAAYEKRRYHLNYYVNLLAVRRKAALIFFAVTFALGASAQTVTTYDASPTASGTFPTALNLGGTVAGDYIDPGTGFHGFIRTPQGAIVSFNPPADSPASGTTIVFGLNNPGAVVGIYNQSATFVQTGFLRDGSGNFTDIAPVGATLTEANSINDAGTIAGSWVDSSRPAHTHGFVRSTADVYTTFDVTGAISLTVAGINNSGEVAGTYFDSAQHSHGYLRSAAGTITTFDAPSPNVDLQVFGLNDSGTITGWAGNGGTVYHGFVRQGTTITLFDADPTRVETFPQSINSIGTIVGWDSISQNDANGFVRSAAGTVTSLGVAGASNTEPNSVNSLGTISGIWLDASYNRHGFIATFAAAGPPPSAFGCNGTYSGTFNGSLVVTAGQTCNFAGGGVNGNVVLLGGTFGLSNANVSGTIGVAGNATFAIGPGVTIGGGVAIALLYPPSSQSEICGASINGGLTLSLNSSPLMLGSGGASCPGNTINGAVQILENAGAVTVTGNRITGSLTCAGNSAISGGGNTVSGRKLGQCASF